jgi:predicted alpha-1,2-mannosidase
MENKNALDSYKKNGYIYFTEGGQSVSRTLEYAYDDWCIAKAAEQLGKKEDAELFFRRAASWKALFDSTTDFMRPRAGGFLKPFDPYEVSHAYTEGNAWQYSFYVPHDLNTHMELMGGKAAMAEKLDSLFGTSSRLTGRQLPDITGLIGQYAHGNEPSHQIAYQYNYVGQPWKTQSMVRRIMEEMYSDRPDGLCGNEDCGQMSAWYLFSALGFYPVCPGSDQYVIGSPLFTEANIRLENGSNFSIRTENNSRENKYIQEAYLNGKSLGRSFLYVKEVMNGGDLLLKMGSAPNLNWGVGEGNCPVSRSR